jgi:predicted nucleic acid-binding protein
MTDASRVLVDTNVILDVTQQDAQWADWATEAMSRHVDRLLINPLIYAELCYGAGSENEVEGLIAALGLQYAELPRQALYVTSQIYKAYRQRGGLKSAPLADFFIGAHAAVLGIPILTRDTARYRSYFPSVPLITP